MPILNDAVHAVADKMDQQYGNFDNFAQQNGLATLNQNAMSTLQVLSPNTAKTVDALFGAGRILLDSNGNGTIEFSELADGFDVIQKLI